MRYVAFNPPHLLREYLGKSGHEANGRALPDHALQALADGKVLGHEVMVVRGRFEADDNRWFLDLGVTTAHVEATTDYRQDGHRLRLVCPECEMKDGKHKKGCAQ